MVLGLVINPSAVDQEGMADVEEPALMQRKRSQLFQQSRASLRVGPSRMRRVLNPIKGRKSQLDMVLSQRDSDGRG